MLPRSFTLTGFQALPVGLAMQSEYTSPRCPPLPGMFDPLGSAEHLAQEVTQP